MDQINNWRHHGCESNCGCGGVSGCASQNASRCRIRTFCADTEPVQVRAGAVVAAGTRGRAVDPVETGGTADGTVVALETEEKVVSR